MVISSRDSIDEHAFHAVVWCLVTLVMQLFVTVCDSTRLGVAVSITVAVFLFFCFIIHFIKLGQNSILSICYLLFYLLL